MTLLTAAWTLIGYLKSVEGHVNGQDVMVYDGWPFDLIISAITVAATQRCAPRSTPGGLLSFSWSP